MKKTILTLILALFLISFASSQIFIYELNQEVNVTITCLNNGYCSNESSCNINLYSPTGTLVIENQNMTRTDSFFYITYTPTKEGIYAVSGFCTDNNLYGEADYYFEVTRDGNKVATGESIMYIWILIILLLLVVLGIYLSTIIPYKNIEEETRDGKIIRAITLTKYMKLIVIWITSGIALMFLTILTGMINNYVQFIEMKSMFTSIYTFLSIIGSGISMFIMILLFVNFYKDLLWNKTIREHGKAFVEKSARDSR